MSKIKMKPTLVSMSSADFYPEGAGGEYIEITVCAPFKTVVLPGNMFLIDEEEYYKLCGREGLTND